MNSAVNYNLLPASSDSNIKSVSQGILYKLVHIIVYLVGRIKLVRKRGCLAILPVILSEAKNLETFR